MYQLLIDPNDYFESIVVAISVDDFTEDRMDHVINKWTEILSHIENDILSNKIFESRDPWFGFGRIINGQLFNE